jgi:hypothetical protein
MLVTTSKKFKQLMTLRLKTKMLVIMLPLILLIEVGAEAVAEDEVEAEGAEDEADVVGEDEVNRAKMLPPLLSKRNSFLTYFL